MQRPSQLLRPQHNLRIHLSNNLKTLLQRRIRSRYTSIMGRACCIRDCQNSACDKRNLFLIPKDEEQRRQWLEAISPYLREGKKSRKLLYVCDAHFKNNDILQETSIHLKDHSIDKIPYLRVKLKRSSVPSVFDGKQGHPPEVRLPDAENKRNTEPAPEKMDRRESAPEEKRIPSGERETAYTLQTLAKDCKILLEKTDNRIWRCSMVDSGLLISFLGENPKFATKTILVKKDMSTEMRSGGRIFMNNIKKKIESVDDISAIMQKLKVSHACRGIDKSTPCPNGCFESLVRPEGGRCIACRRKRRMKLNRESWSRKAKQRAMSGLKEAKKLIRDLKRRNERLTKNLALAKKNIETLKGECASASNVSIEKAIENLPFPQQEAVKALLAAAQCNGRTGIRYSASWILECIFLCIKSRRAYLHLLSRKILQLPSLETLNKYLKNMEPSYGFNAETYDILQAKVAEIQSVPFEEAELTLT